MNIVDIKVLSPLLKGMLPKYQTEGAAAVDLCAAIEKEMCIEPGESLFVSSGVSVYIKNPAYAAMVLPRSGLGAKKGIVLANLVGLIDSDYQGELGMYLWNRGAQPYYIQPLERVAQMVIVPVMQVTFNVVEEFEQSERGENGWGSTS